jgi:GcrA cell cycle regulator
VGLHLQPKRQATESIKIMWTDERVEKMKILYAAGKSASQVAAELGEGATKNSVLGKLHRIGAAKMERVSKPKPVNKQPRVVRKRIKSELSQPMEPLKVADVVSLEIPFNELKRWQCKSIAGEPAFNAPACGHRVQDGSSYCPMHHRLYRYYPPVKARDRYHPPQQKYTPTTQEQAADAVEFLETAA